MKCSVISPPHPMFLKKIPEKDFPGEGGGDTREKTHTFFHEFFHLSPGINVSKFVGLKRGQKENCVNILQIHLVTTDLATSFRGDKL